MDFGPPLLFFLYLSLSSSLSLTHTHAHTRTETLKLPIRHPFTVVMTFDDFPFCSFEVLLLSVESSSVTWIHSVSHLPVNLHHTHTVLASTHTHTNSLSLLSSLLSISPCNLKPLFGLSNRTMVTLALEVEVQGSFCLQLIKGHLSN